LLIPGSITWRSIAAIEHGWSCGISSDGILYCWGHNDLGMLGRGWRGSDDHQVLPVYGSGRYSSVDGRGFHTCGLATDGALHCWGYYSWWLFPDNVARWVPTRTAPTLTFTSMVDWPAMGSPTAGGAGWDTMVMVPGSPVLPPFGSPDSVDR
jgi:hypothetical protein